MPENPSPPPGKSESAFEAAYRAYLQCVKAYWAELDVGTVDLKQVSHHAGIIWPCMPCPVPAHLVQPPAPGMWPCWPCQPPGFSAPSTYGTYGTYGTSAGCLGTAGQPGQRPG
jgi:hypothetical protein